MPSVKKDAPEELVEAVARIESNADQAILSQPFLQHPSNIAAWGLLTGGVALIEEEIAKIGDNSPFLDAALMNAGIFVPLAIHWSKDRGRFPSNLARRRWDSKLATDIMDALFVARQYAGFLLCFPMWHENRYAAELLALVKS